MKALRKTTACMLLLFMLSNIGGVEAFAEDIDNYAEIVDLTFDCGEDWGSEESVSSDADDGCEELPADEGYSVPAESVSSECTDEGEESSAEGSEMNTALSAGSNTAEKDLTSIVDNTASESSDSPEQAGEVKSLSGNSIETDTVCSDSPEQAGEVKTLTGSSSETDTVCTVGSGSAGGNESDSEAVSAVSDSSKSAVGAGYTENSNNDKEENDDGKDKSRGNAASKAAGLVLKGEGEFDVLITGTLRSDGTPILIDKEVNPQDVSITVWKIEKSAGPENDKESHIVKEGIMGGEPSVTDKAKTVEAAIKYIIRIEPSQENIISLAGVGDIHDFRVAKEGETVTLKIAVPDGYKIIGAYNGIGKRFLLRKDGHGDYYVTVPRGGGVYLSAELEKDGDDDDADRKVEDLCKYINERCEQKKYEDDSECNRIIYDLNGGTLEGDKGPVIIEAEPGKEYTLLDAPVKKGEHFVRWASSCEDIHVSQPGESFRFTHCVKFSAVWDDNERKSCRRCHGGDSDHDDDRDDIDDDDDRDDIADDESDDGPDVTETVLITTESEKELDINSIKVDSNPAVGVKIMASRDVDVDDEIIVTGGDQGATGVMASAEGKTIETEIETGDGMTVKSEGSSVGIEAYASEDGAMSFEFEGDITVSFDS